MSSSSSPGIEKPETSENPEVHEVRPFPYADAMAYVSGDKAGRSGAAGVSSAGSDAESDALHRESAAREAGIREGELRARAAYDAQLDRVHESLRMALAGFARERETYYQKVESEVVQLALAIARKVLQREANVDPLLLAGLVRVALDKIESKTRVTVRVHPQQADDCRAYFARCMEPKNAPEVVEDSAIEMDHTILQTDLGTTEIGIEPQLKEIERGLMDLMAQRPLGS